MKSAKSCTALHVMCTLLFTTIMSICAIAEENAHSSPPMDVVLIMDSSGSMKNTDPDQLRKPAAKLFISLLSPTDRSSVVSFSDKGYPVAFLTPVDSTKNKERLFSAVDKISTRGMFTNLYGALEGARRVFERNPVPDRKKIIILMTDGKMDLGDAIQTDALKKQLKEEMLPWLAKDDIEVHTIAFTEQSETQLLKELSSATNASFNIAKTDKELHTVYSTIFEQNKSPNMLPFDGEKFTIDPAIKEVTIVGSKDNADVVLTLLSPSNQQISVANKSDNINWFQSSQFDIITITTPESGQWQIKASTGKNKAYIVTDLQLKLAIEPESPIVGEGVFIRAWLEDKGKIIDKESILATISPELHITTPEGENHVLALDIEADEQDETKASGVFFSYIAFPSLGKHSIQVIMTSNTFKRERNTQLETIDPESAQHASGDEHQAQQHEQASAHSDHGEATHQEQSDHQPAHEDEMGHDGADSGHHEVDITPPLPDIGAVTEEHASHQPDADEADHHKAEEEHHPAKDEKHGDDKHDDHGDHDKESGSSAIMLAIYIFLGINVVLLLGGGTAYLVIKKRKKKKAADIAQAPAASNEKGEPAKDDEADQEKAA